MRVPLFPLKTVLFPGGVLPLKVFEQRYIDMSKDCLANEGEFGVCLLTSGDEVMRQGGAAPEFSAIGTLARITQWDMPQLGILHLRTVGGERFRVRSHETAPSGLVLADIATMAAEPPLAMATGDAPMVRLLELIASRVGPANFPADPSYDDASWVSFRLAEYLPLPLPIKQTMLEVSDASIRLSVLRKFLADQGLI